LISLVRNPIRLPLSLFSDGPVCELTLKHLFFFFMRFPGEDNVGSCTYSDPCTLIASYSDKLCPALQPYNVPCKCPFPATQFSAGPVSFFLKNPGINWLTNGTSLPCFSVAVFFFFFHLRLFAHLFTSFCSLLGDLRVKVAMTRVDGSTLGCFQVSVSIASSN
jgi:hypothetical protein